MNLRCQRGQIMPVALGALLLTIVGLVVLYNQGTRVSKKALTTNAADAAAYSAGVWTARHLNFMAYTNRAMVANHVATGHLVSYIGWMRYVERVAEEIARVTSFIPYVGTITETVRRIASGVRSAADYSGELLVPLSQINNELLSASQHAAYLALRPGRYDSIMGTVARAHHSAMRINDSGIASGMPGSVRAQVWAGIVEQRLGPLTFVKSYSPSSDDNEMSGLAGRSFGKSHRWITNRKGLTIDYVFRKRGGTRQITRGGELTDWKSHDYAQAWSWSIKRFGWYTLVDGKADAQEFVSSYQGVPNYYNVANRDRQVAGLRMFALAGLDGSNISQKDFMAITQRGEPVSAMAEAEVFYRMPGIYDDEERTHFNQLYNPFWDVRMVPSGVAGF